MFEKIFGFDQSVFNRNHFAQRAAKMSVFIKTRRIKVLTCNTREIEDDDIEIA
jgi:hypothetical protein